MYRISCKLSGNLGDKQGNTSWQVAMYIMHNRCSPISVFLSRKCRTLFNVVQCPRSISICFQYNVHCDAVPNLPTVNININGHDYPLTGEEYIWKVSSRKLSGMHSYASICDQGTENICNFVPHSVSLKS